MNSSKISICNENSMEMKFHRTGQKFTKTYVVSGKGCATAGVLRTSQLPPTPNLHKNRLTGPNQPWLGSLLLWYEQ